MLTDILSPERVFMDLRPVPKEQLLGEMVQRLEDLGHLADTPAVTALLAERERMISTGVKHGFAFPHAFSRQVPTLNLTIGVIEGGTDYESLDGEPVEFILLLLGPPDHQDDHLRVLARLSSIASRPGMIEALREPKTPEALYDLFTESDRLIANQP